MSYGKRSTVVALTAAAVAFALSPAPALAQTTTWTDGLGDWFTAGNWDSGVPDSAASAQVNNGGTAQVGAPDAVTSTLTLGLNASDSGAVAVDGNGTLNVSLFDPQHCSLCVGSQGMGTLNVTNGGALNTVLSGQIAERPGSTGTVTVDGQGSSWTVRTLDVGLQGTGRLNITNGGTVESVGVLARAEVGGFGDERTAR